MKNLFFDIGDRVEIFQDPLTRLNLEGFAVIKRIVSFDVGTWNGYKLMDCIVKFDNDFSTYRRQIYLKPF